MAATAFRDVKDCKAEVLKDFRFLYIHCVSENDFEVYLKGIKCVKLVCRQVHVSFVDKMNERRVALIPCVVGGEKADDLFNNIRSPALTRIIVSSDLEFCDDDDERQGSMLGTLLWNFEIIPAPATEYIAPTKAAEYHTVDDKLPPLDLERQLKCNCFLNPVLCLCSFNVRQEILPEKTDILCDLLADDDVDESQSEESDEESPLSDINCLTTSTPSSTLFSEYFKIRGSAWEKSYQDALQLVADKKSKGEKLNFTIIPEPNNIRDKNAHQFALLHNGQTHVMGYCGVEKLPKLIKAIDRHEVGNINLGELKRQWVTTESVFKFQGGLNIIKCGPWDKNDPKNRYNSVIKHTRLGN